jgi:CBS domain-containing protein
MKIKEAMTRDVRTIAPSDTIRQAAELMAEIDAGVLPVEENDRMVGMITDRDIAIRAVGAGLGPDATARDVKYCYEDDDVDEVCENMADQQIRRLPVVDRDKRLVGIVSLSDLAKRADTSAAGEALEGITRPGGLHTQEPLN